MPQLLPVAAVRSYRTFSPLPKLTTAVMAVYFLLHFPWIHILQALPGTLPIEPGLSSAPLSLRSASIYFFPANLPRK